MGCRTYGRPATIVAWGMALAGLLISPLPATAHAAQETAPEATAGQPRWLDTEGRPLPFVSFEEAEQFLRAAEVVSSEKFGVGITGLDRIVLELDGVRARAAFHDFHETTRDIVMQDRRFREHHDSFRNQCAAYELGRLLGITSVPPTVCRRVDGDEGSVQLWVEAAMTEKERLEEGRRPPSAQAWIRQVNRMRLFDALVFNDDRHARNFLMDDAGDLWMIDHTRAFQHGNELPEPLRFAFCERSLWERLRTLTDEALGDALGPYLDVGQLASLRSRRAKLVEHIERRIAERGEGATLIDG